MTIGEFFAWKFNDAVFIVGKYLTPRGRMKSIIDEVDDEKRGNPRFIAPFLSLATPT